MNILRIKAIIKCFLYALLYVVLILLVVFFEYWGIEYLIEYKGFSNWIYMYCVLIIAKCVWFLKLFGESK